MFTTYPIMTGIPASLKFLLISFSDEETINIQVSHSGGTRMSQPGETLEMRICREVRNILMRETKSGMKGKKRRVGLAFGTWRNQGEPYMHIQDFRRWKEGMKHNDIIHQADLICNAILLEAINSSTPT